MLKDNAKTINKTINALLIGEPLSKKKFCFYLLFSLSSALLIALALYLLGHYNITSDNSAMKIFIAGAKDPITLFLLFHVLIIETIYLIFIPMICLDIITTRFKNEKIVLISFFFGCIHMSNGLSIIQILPLAVATLPAVKMLKENGLHFAIIHHVFYDTILIIIAIIVLIISGRI